MQWQFQTLDPPLLLTQAAIHALHLHLIFPASLLNSTSLFSEYIQAHTNYFKPYPCFWDVSKSLCSTTCRCCSLPKAAGKDCAPTPGSVHTQCSPQPPHIPPFRAQPGGWAVDVLQYCCCELDPSFCCLQETCATAGAPLQIYAW